MNRTARRLTVGLLSTALITAAGAFAATPVIAADSLPVRLVVGLKPGFDAKAALPSLDRLGLSSAEAAGRKRSTLLAEVGAKTLSVPRGKVDATLAALRQDPSVAYASEDGQSEVAEVTPNDPLYSQGHQPELGQIKVPAAWQTTTGSEVIVAVVDTGVSAVGDLTGKVLDGYDFFNYDNDPTDDGQFPHGTVVSSLIAGAGDNGEGLAGVCWQCKILPVKVLGATGRGYNTDIADGIIYAVQNHAQIINLSLGSAYYDKTVAAAVAYANYSGVLVVAAAGNDGVSSPFYPAALPDVIAVGGTDTRRGSYNRVSFSNWSKSWVDVAAPAITAGMFNNGTYCYDGTSTADCVDNSYPADPYMVQGTSFSAPLVSGVAALVKSVHSDYNGWSLGNAIVRSTVPGTNSWTKYGLVDAAKAVAFNTVDTTPPIVTGVSPKQFAPVHGSIAVTPTGLKDTYSGIGLVELYVNGAFKSRSYTAPYAPTLNTTAYNGRTTVRLKVTDKAGNVTWSGNRVLLVDNVKPKLTVTSWPANKAKIKGTITIKAKATDVGTGVSKVELLVNGKVVATDTKSAYALAFKVAKQARTMKVQVRVYDKAGNYVVSSKRTYYRR